MSRVFLNGRVPPYMESSDPIKLSNEQVTHAAMAMTHSALQIASASFLLLFNRMGHTPAEAIKLLQDACDEAVQPKKEGAVK